VTVEGALKILVMVVIYGNQFLFL